MNEVTSGTVNPALTEAQKIEGDINPFLPLADVAGPVGTLAAGVAPALEGVANQVLAEAPHQTALTDLINGVHAAAPLITAAASSGLVSPAAASAATDVLPLLESLFNLLKGIL
jgi:hypothetical protein